MKLFHPCKIHFGELGIGMSCWHVFLIMILKLINDTQPKTISSRKKDDTTNKKNIVHKTKPCFHSDLSHAHNVLEKKCLCGHGNCVEMHVYMQINNVGKEKQMFWISQNTLSRSLSTRVWMFRKKCLGKLLRPPVSTVLTDFLPVTHEKQSQWCL